MATTIGEVTIAAGRMTPEGRLCALEVYPAQLRSIQRAGMVAIELNPDEVRALIDALTPYARRRKPWPARSRKP